MRLMRKKKKRNIEEVRKYIVTKSPEYSSFLQRNDVIEAMPPNLSDEKKDAFFIILLTQRIRE